MAIPPNVVDYLSWRLLKKDQYEVLKIICNTYQTSFSEYMQQALVEAPTR
jgi:hypothetical protein